VTNNPSHVRAGTIPNLVISQRVIDKMATAARHYIQDETGEAMIGLLVPGANTNGIPTLYVLDTISPDESAVRQMHTFQQGDERQDELIWWLQENWQYARKAGKDTQGKALHAKWDVPLRYLGDWHKQPGFMIQPSGGDLMTALGWISDPENNMEFLLAPIVTVGHPATTAWMDGTANFVTVPQGNGLCMRVDFWYIDRYTRMFQPILPAVYPADQLPGLTDYPWHLTNPDRVNAEFALFKKDNLFTSLVLWNADNQVPLEVCFMTARLGVDKVLILVTPWDYPKSPPSARVTPFISMKPEDDMYETFELLWQQSEPVADPPGWKWSQDKYLVDYMRALEEHLNIRPTIAVAEPQAAETAATADHETESQAEEEKES
jgi:hypothetical protein